MNVDRKGLPPDRAKEATPRRARRRPLAPHADTLDAALTHYNDSFRRRYRLPDITEEALQTLYGRPDWAGRIERARANGVVDAICALIAQTVLQGVTRYTIGSVDALGNVTNLAFGRVDDSSYRGHVLLVNPLGGIDNWADASDSFRYHGSENARRVELAGLASEERPDTMANRELLASAVSEDRRAIVLPPDEGFSARRAAEVGFIFGVSAETLRSWNRTHRSEVSGHKPGAPRKNR